MVTSTESAEVPAHDAQREQNPWATLRQIWSDRYPPEAPSPQSFSLVVKLVVTPVLIARGISPSTWFRNCGANVIDVMVIAYSAATALVLALPELRGSYVPTTAALVWAYFRILDVGTQKLMEVLVHSLRPPQQSSIQRTLLLSALNVYEIIASYAIIYLISGGVQQNGTPLPSASAAFYFSTVTALTVGYGDFIPATDATRRVVVSQIVVVALFIVAWFPVAVSLLFPRDANASNSRDSRSNTR